MICVLRGAALGLLASLAQVAGDEAGGGGRGSGGVGGEGDEEGGGREETEEEGHQVFTTTARAGFLRRASKTLATVSSLRPGCSIRFHRLGPSR